MDHKKTLLLSSLGMVPAAFVPAMAADNGVAPNGPVLAQAPVAATAFTWTGLYLGVQAGGIRNVAHDTAFVPNTAASDGCWIDDCGLKQTEIGNGLLGGIQAGYNFQFGSYVIGAEADIAASTAAHNRQHARTNGADYTWRAHTGIDALGTARLRAGYTFGGALAYVTGGVAVGKIRSAYQVNDGGPADYAWSDRSDWRFGYAGGAGLEMALGSNRWSLKAEGLYYAFPDKVSHVSSDGIVAHGLKEWVSGTVGRLGVNYRF